MTFFFAYFDVNSCIWITTAAYIMLHINFEIFGFHLLLTTFHLSLSVKGFTSETFALKPYTCSTTSPEGTLFTVISFLFVWGLNTCSMFTNISIIWLLASFSWFSLFWVSSMQIGSPSLIITRFRPLIFSVTSPDSLRFSSALFWLLFKY